MNEKKRPTRKCKCGRMMKLTLNGWFYCAYCDYWERNEERD